MANERDGEAEGLIDVSGGIVEVVAGLVNVQSKMVGNITGTVGRVAESREGELERGYDEREEESPGVSLGVGSELEQVSASVDHNDVVDEGGVSPEEAELRRRLVVLVLEQIGGEIAEELARSGGSSGFVARIRGELADQQPKGSNMLGTMVEHSDVLEAVIRGPLKESGD